MLVFVYGTLKRNYGNNVLLQQGGKFVDVDVIDGYKLVYAMGKGSFPFAVENEGTGIKGEIFDISEDYLDYTLKNLDQLEGHPSWYRRVPARTREGRDVEFYMMPNPRDRNGEECSYDDDNNCFEWKR